ncbi:unnamed protein product [Mycena citricolor]|uniref:Uncharacterized protein n=1 Tax=Mycena citricolor TaxID=2018698 RepID=A0AAD2K2I8_9AGAR|nr:unnamed protein product [Mycena citricolor]
MLSNLSTMSFSTARSQGDSARWASGQFWGTVRVGKSRGLVAIGVQNPSKKAHKLGLECRTGC